MFDDVWRWLATKLCVFFCCSEMFQDVQNLAIFKDRVLLFYYRFSRVQWCLRYICSFACMCGLLLVIVGLVYS